MTQSVTPITPIAALTQAALLTHAAQLTRAALLTHATQRTHAPRPPRPCCSRSFAAALAAVAVGLSLAAATPAAADNANQTQTLSPVVPVGAPFRLRVEELAWSGDPLPALQSAASARHGDRLLFTGGKTTGLHGFSCSSPNNNFPFTDFHRSITVIDLASGAVFQRSIDEPASGLSPSQRAALASTNQLSLQDGGTLLAVGGYGIADGGDYTTFRSLRLFDVAGTIAWAMGDATPLSDHLRFLDPPANAPEALRETFFTLTGGVMVKVGEEYWMCLGQNFQGAYTDGCAQKWVQVYSQQIRRFAIDLAAKDPQPLFTGASAQPEWARRRDLNVFPARVPGGEGAVALSGVFTPGDHPGIWTVPIVVGPDGEMSMPDPADPATLRQGLNIYDAARLSMWSAARGENWLVVLGGLGYQVVSGGAFIEDRSVPYSNELFAVRYAPGAGPGGAAWSQHLLGASYPTILSPAHGVPFYFGTETDAFPLVDTDAHGMLDLDALLASKSPVRLAVLYGGMISEGQALHGGPSYPTGASNRLFEVCFEPGPGCPADLSGSGAVDGQDLGQLLSAWGPVPAGAIVRADLDGDGFVGAKDLAQLLAEWGPCPKR